MEVIKLRFSSNSFASLPLSAMDLVSEYDLRAISGDDQIPPFRFSASRTKVCKGSENEVNAYELSFVTDKQTMQQASSTSFSVYTYW